MKLSLTLIAATAATLASALPADQPISLAPREDHTDAANQAYELALKAAEGRVQTPNDVQAAPEPAAGNDKRQWPPNYGYPYTITTTPCYFGPNMFLPVMATYPPNTYVAITCKTNSGFYNIGGMCYTPWWNISPNVVINAKC